MTENLLNNLYDQIKHLADGTIIDDQLKAKEILCNTFFPHGLKDGTFSSIITKYRHVLIKFIESANQELQEEGARIIADITYTTRENTQLLIGVIPKLLSIIPSAKETTKIYIFQTLVNISFVFPEKIQNAVPFIIPILCEKNAYFLHLGALFVTNFVQCEQNIPKLFEENILPLLINILKTTNEAAIKAALDALTDIIYDSQSCQRVKDLKIVDALKVLLKNCTRKKRKTLLVRKVKHPRIIGMKLKIKVAAANLLQKIASFGEITPADNELPAGPVVDFDDLLPANENPNETAAAALNTVVEINRADVESRPIEQFSSSDNSHSTPLSLSLASMDTVGVDERAGSHFLPIKLSSPGEINEPPRSLYHDAFAASLIDL